MLLKGNAVQIKTTPDLMRLLLDNGNKRSMIGVYVTFLNNPFQKDLAVSC